MAIFNFHKYSAWYRLYLGTKDARWLIREYAEVKLSNQMPTQKGSEEQPRHHDFKLNILFGRRCSVCQWTVRGAGAAVIFSPLISARAHLDLFS